MKSLPWLKLYTDLPECVKLRELGVDVQLLYIWYLCLYRRGSITEGTKPSQVAWILHVSEAFYVDGIVKLVDAKLLLKDGTPKGWGERQSDVGANDRVKRCRARKIGDSLPSVTTRYNSLPSVTTRYPPLPVDGEENRDKTVPLVRSVPSASQRDQIDDYENIFDPLRDPVKMASALCGEDDDRSRGGFGKQYKRIGDYSFRVLFAAFWGELQSGEEPRRRGAALMSRLKALPSSVDVDEARAAVAGLEQTKGQT